MDIRSSARTWKMMAVSLLIVVVIVLVAIYIASSL